jgi:predicted GTPase
MEHIKDENELMKDNMDYLVAQVNESLRKTEIELKDRIANFPQSEKIKDSVTKIIANLRNELSGINPERATNVAVIGQTGTGKTALITALLQQPATQFLRSEDCKWLKVNDTMNVLDSCGFQNNKKREVTKKLKSALKERSPDLVFVVLSAQVLRTWNDYIKEFGELLDTVMDACKKAKSTLPCFFTKKSVPIIWVVTKMDAGSDELGQFQWSRNLSYDDWKQLLDQNQNAIIDTVKNRIKLFKHFSETDPICLTAVPDKSTRQTDYGIDTLSILVQTSLPLNIQIQSNSKKRYEAKRRAMAMKIISTYSALCATISLLPLIDIPLTCYLNDAMLITLESLRTHPDRTAKSFSATNNVILAGTYAVRSALFATFFLLELTGVGIAVSLPAGAAVAASSTTGIGVQAYNYYTQEPILLE